MKRRTSQILGLLVVATLLAGWPDHSMGLPAAVVGLAGYQAVTFDILAGFKFNTPGKEEKAATSVIPSSIRRLNGKSVSIVGFVVPLDINPDATVKQFGLFRTRGSCCYGITPKMNEAILCDVAPGKQLHVIMDIPMAISGKLKVGEEYVGGELLCIYRMQAEGAEMQQQ